MQIFSITVAISLVISLALASPTRGPVDDGFGVGCNNRDLDFDGILNENECDPQLGSDSSTDFTSSNFTTEAPKVMNVTQQTTTSEPSTTTVAPITTVASTTLTPRVSSTVSPTTANYTPSVPEQTTQTKSSSNTTTVTPALSSTTSTMATVKPAIAPSTASNLLVTQPKQMNISVEKRNQILTTNQTVSSTSTPILAQQAKSSGSVLVLANVVVFAAISAALCVHASVI